jgi:predicted ATPase
MIARMKRDDPRAWQRVMGTMRRIVPTLEDVEVAPTHDRRLALSFREEGVGRAWTSEEVSDGTVQCLALFAALNEKGIPLLVFEEPENSLHPAVLRAFVDACRALVDVQVILTTHSPVLLSYVEPSEVTVVWRMDGRTHAEGLERLYPHARETWTTGKGTVYDMLDSGLVRESLPPSA